MVRRKEFIAIAFNPENKTFIVYPAFFSISDNNVYPSHRAQIVLLKINKAFTIVLLEYSNFTNVFPSKLIIKLLKHIEINTYAIKLIDGKQLPYRWIYSLGSVKLANLKTCVKINQSNHFIRPSKSLASALILFDQKLDDSFCLYINY